MKNLILLLVLCIKVSISYSQIVSSTYQEMQRKVAKGWNTWSYGDMLTHVLLPDGLSMDLNFRQAFIGTPRDKSFFLQELSVDTSGLVKPIAHSVDGKYTELLINNWKGNTIRIQTTVNGDEIMVLVTPEVKSSIQYYVELESGIMWNREGTVKRNGENIVANVGNRELIIRTTGTVVERYHPYTSAHLITKQEDAVAFYTGSKKTLGEIKGVIENAKNEFYNQSLKYGELADAYCAIQSVLGWNTIYDAEKNRIITPVARDWNQAWQGYVLFEWDTYYGAFLSALVNKELAYSNAIAVTKGINQEGFVGQWQMPEGVALHISQPPVGSMICWMIYEKFKEKWFLEEVFNELLSWNRWWVNNRMNQGFLSWGAKKGDDRQMAAWESGLDNAPMYDDAVMMDVNENSILNIADVGLNSMYTEDCIALAKMAKVLGKKAEEKELLTRAMEFTKIINKLWDNDFGLYRNKYLNNNYGFCHKLSPTLFYPMISGIPSKKQAQRMVQEHFYNPSEFYGDYIIPSCSRNDGSYDNFYWRGAIWPPMNFMVYLGLRNYDKLAAADLANKSYDLFIKAWKEHNYVFENINADKGVSKVKDQLNTDPYYHWGALMGIMKFMEEGKF